jgi:hypothetical protein
MNATPLDVDRRDKMIRDFMQKRLEHGVTLTYEQAAQTLDRYLTIFFKKWNERK